MSEVAEWYQFQEDICDYFESIGATAQTNVSVQGVRTSHDVDILVTTRYLGEDLVWVVEAKKWQKRVNKLQVLALRTIIDDIGADRGFIVSEAGFQSGAYEAAENSNVKLKTFDQLKTNTKDLVEAEILKVYKKRIELLEARYYSHDKETRREYGLKCDLIPVFPIYFSTGFLISTAKSAVIAAERRKYPIDLDTDLVEKRGDLKATNFQQLVNWLNLNLNHLDEKILMAEARMLDNGDFSPKIRFKSEDHKAFDRLHDELMYKLKTRDADGPSILELQEKASVLLKNLTKK